MDALISKYNKSPVQVNKHNLANLKIALNDLLIEYLVRDRGYVQRHTYTDLKIAVGMVSVACAIVTCYMSMHYTFAEYRTALIVTLGIYFSINFLLEICSRFFVRNTIFEGYSRHGTLTIDGFNKAVDENYKLIIYKDGKAIPGNFSKSIYELYDDAGVLDHEMFLREIALIFT